MEDSISEDWIRRCYDPELSRQCGERLSELYAVHLSRLQTREQDFQSWVTPEANIASSSSYLKTNYPKFRNGSEDRGACLEGLVERFSELVSVSLERSQGLHHPRCAGHQVPASMPWAGWFDAMTSLTNQVQGVYEMGPWSVAVERSILNAVGEVLGFPVGEFGSLVTSGGSLANLTALLAARQAQFPKWWKSGFKSTERAPVVVVNQDAHYCVDRAVGVMGLGTDQLVSVPLDANRRMDVDALRNILTDLR
ncbi:MAG: pyridoxal-dependent decarboxylase, partial [Planctomycetota bacterium]|nr:pyridoxal-dependent decarboxylase [Planctomycetota bacterium]